MSKQEKAEIKQCFSRTNMAVYSINNVTDFADKKINMIASMWDADGNEKSVHLDYNVSMWPTYEVSLAYFDFGLAMRHFQGTKQDKFRIGNTLSGYIWESDVFFEKEGSRKGLLSPKESRSEEHTSELQSH